MARLDSRVGGGDISCDLSRRKRLRILTDKEKGLSERIKSNPLWLIVCFMDQVLESAKLRSVIVVAIFQKDRFGLVVKSI